MLTKYTFDLNKIVIFYCSVFISNSTVLRYSLLHNIFLVFFS